MKWSDHITVDPAHQAIAQRWWNERITKYELVISELVIREAAVGNPNAAASRLETLKDVGILGLSEEAISRAEILVLRGPIPRQYVEDATCCYFRLFPTVHSH